MRWVVVEFGGVGDGVMVVSAGVGGSVALYVGKAAAAAVVGFGGGDDGGSSGVVGVEVEEWGRRVRESDIEDQIDREVRKLFGFFEKSPPEKFPPAAA
nr:hypothetical protein [Tanacetum cinerariifolium]